MSTRHLARKATLPLLLAAIALAGCFGSSNDSDVDAPQERPFVGRTVRIIAPREIAERPDWQIMLDEWGEQTGAEWQLTTWNSSSESLPPHDVLILPTPDLHDVAAKAPLAPIPPELQDPNRLAWLDLFQGLRERVASINGEAAVVPVSSPVLVCYYRRDLLAKAGLRPPETWAEYQTLLEKLGDWAPGLTAVEPWSEDFRATMFLARAASYAKHPGNYSFYFDISTGEPLIDTPGFVRALDDAVKAVAKMPADVLTYSPADCRREFFKGRAALAIAFETGPGNPTLPGTRPSRTADPEGKDSSTPLAGESPPESSTPTASFEAGFVRLPGTTEVYNPSSGRWDSPPGRPVNRVTLTGFDGLCVAVSAATPDEAKGAAWNLVETIAVDNRATAFARAESPCRNSQLDDPTRWIGEELAEVARPGDYLTAVTESLRDINLVAELPFIMNPQFRNDLADALDSVLKGNAPPEQALKQAATQWQAAAEKAGPAAVLNSYRASLGLPPRPTK